MAAPQQIADGLCLRFSGDIQNQPALSVEMAVNLLIRGTQASLQLPFSWGYIDRPTDGALYLVFIPSHMAFPNDGMRFQEGEQRFAIAAGGGREVEVMESKFGFTPGSGENAANRVRRKFRMVKGGNPQLILVHYGRGQAAPINPAFNQPTRSYPLQPANLPAVYVAGEKAGQKVMPNTAGGPPVGNVPGGVPGGIPPGMQGNMPGGHPGGMAGGMGGGMPGGPGGPGPQQLPPNPGAGPGPMQGVPNQPHPSHSGHPPIQPPGPQGVPPPIGMGYSGPATTQSMLVQQNRQMEALERRNAQEREQRARGSMNAQRPTTHADEDEETEKEMISTRTLALTRFQRNHEFMDEIFTQAAFGDRHPPKRKSPWSIFDASELESKTAKLDAEIAELQRQVEERRSQRSALASVDGDVSMSAISV